MTFEVFQEKVNALIEKAGGNIKVRFCISDGKYIARCSDGTEIVGNSESIKVSVRWNHRQHQAAVAI